MQVIGAAPGRTGTLSTKAALETLGYGPCHHMVEVMGRPDLAQEWTRVLAGGRPDWTKIFAGYQSTVDWPSTSYWRQLIEAYPEAKVLLTVRDPDRWYASMQQTILSRAFQPVGPRRWLAMGVFRMTRPAQAQLVGRLRWMVEDFFGVRGRAPTREEAITAYERHLAEVREAVDPGRLLTFEVKQGWEPLCDFLQVPVPDEPFPRVNESATFGRDVGRHLRAAGSGR